MAEKFIEWAIYVKDQYLDTVFFQESCTRTDIIKSLVRKDCYPQNITAIRRFDLE